MKTRGASGACSATAETVSEVNGSRFLRRIETTSTEVQLHRAINTSSMGLGPAGVRGVRIHDDMMAAMRLRIVLLVFLPGDRRAHSLSLSS